ncbi:uncharacterized protein P174DRAFT_431914 [Aspergillus novofumigatus IBT 16806]|uniref:Uncharacterized protein n=1 Tax=Aspergillus novofumigatus (strain IBT 16806) TaxID=1392255 RepID=A0A2I1C4K7_ASPN1|nr:uncharacterized protein P174DRAFT_431914 [Aspergillus novofumigatus IBT 16806]PKX92521.1 hypothetical protein P174DRAFT_431914 [Aspergillus novofumigatus IBT 16806]
MAARRGPAVADGFQRQNCSRFKPAGSKPQFKMQFQTPFTAPSTLRGFRLRVSTALLDPRTNVESVKRIDVSIKVHCFVLDVSQTATEATHSCSSTHPVTHIIAHYSAPKHYLVVVTVGDVVTLTSASNSQLWRCKNVAYSLLNQHMTALYKMLVIHSPKANKAITVKHAILRRIIKITLQHTNVSFKPIEPFAHIM